MDKVETETWNLAEIIDYINNHKCFSPDKKRSSIEIVNSIGRSIDIFRYHGVTIHREAERFFKNKDIPELERFLMLSGISQHQAAYETSRLACEGNFIACVHTVRNMYDIFSQLINDLILDSAIADNVCDLNKVISALHETPLKEALSNLKNSDSFYYISAFSNTVKHRVLVRSTSRIAMSQDRFEPHINSFEYNGRQHHGRWMMAALSDVEDVLNSIIHCGIYFNDLLREKKVF